MRPASVGGIATIARFARASRRCEWTVTRPSRWTIRLTGESRTTWSPRRLAIFWVMSCGPPWKRHIWAPLRVLKLRFERARVGLVAGGRDVEQREEQGHLAGFGPEDRPRRDRHQATEALVGAVARMGLSPGLERLAVPLTGTPGLPGRRQSEPGSRADPAWSPRLRRRGRSSDPA